MAKEEKELPRIVYSCYAHTSREGEQFIAQHIFGCVISGTSEVSVGDKTYVYHTGDFRFFKKNQLSKFIKYPPAGGEFKTISIGIDQQTLHSISDEYNLHKSGTYTGENALILKPNRLFTNYIKSLTPYLDGGVEINNRLTALKVKEAVLILLETNPELKDVLFDFSEPGKIDLEAFMNKNFHFNVQLNRFAYLTGRSLATFKRDFDKIFHSTPSRWLLQRRLQEAYHLIKERGKAPVEVYLELGFEDLSHFSFVFKKAFGMPPSQV
jgi:AraC-like DNA-binding protein